MVATLARPKSAKLSPTAPAGVPYQPPAQTTNPPMRINEPVNVVGAWTGITHIRGGDNPNGPEGLQITPPPGPVNNPSLRKGPVSAATGINAVVGVDPLAQQLAAKKQLLNAQSQQTDTQQAGLMAAGNVYNQTAQTFPLQQQQNNQQRQVLQQQGIQTNAQQGYIQQQQQDTGLTQQETAGIQAASHDYADKAAVGQALNARNNTDYLYGLAGQATPTEVDTANGADNPNLPVGVRAKLQTSEQLKTNEAQQAQQTRALALKASSEVVDMLGINVDKAKQLADSYGIDVADAKLNVAKAQNAVNYADLNEKQAGIGVSRANNALGIASLPPEPGKVRYTDPLTGVTSDISQGEKDQRARDYNKNFDQANADNDAVRYANNPTSAPVNYLLQNMTQTTTNASGGTSYQAGLFTRTQVIEALKAKGYTQQQAIDLTEAQVNTPGPVKAGSVRGGDVPGGPVGSSSGGG